MKNIFRKTNLLFIVFVLFFSLNHAVLADSSIQLDTVLTDKLDEANPGKQIDVFAPDTPVIYLIWKSNELKDGQALKSVWVADDTNNVAPAHYKIDEATFNLNKDFKNKMMSTLPGSNWHGNFSLSKPDAGWPLGKYHVDIYVDKEFVKSINFTVVAAKSAAGMGK